MCVKVNKDITGKNGTNLVANLIYYDSTGIRTEERGTEEREFAH